MKFKSDIEVQVGLKDNAGGLGSLGEVLSSTATGVEWLAQSAISASSNFTYYEVKNSSGLAISKGKAVMAVGTDGNSGHILIDELIADGTIPARYFLGVLETTLNNGDIGRVISFGELDQFNTLGQNGETWVDGQVLWCDPVNAGDFTTTEPDGPNLKIPAAFIMNAAANGKIQVRVQTNEGVKDLYDTSINGQIDGDVLAWNNTSKVWFNDSTLNVDYTNGRIGIGTTIPGRPLHVIGQMAIANAVGASSTGALLISCDSTSNKIYSRTVQNATGAHPIDFIQTSSTVMRIASNGNVGIGTTSPDSKLDVTGGDITVNTEGTGFMTFKYGAVGSETSKGSITTDGVDLKVNATADLLLLPTGNVGIGTTSPGTYAKLEVSTSQQYGGIVLSNGTNNVGWISGNSASNDNGQLSLSSGGVQKIQINAASNSYLNGGNVGIGTVSPSKKLHVVGTTQIDAAGAGGTLLLGRANGEPSIKAQTDNGGYLIMDSTSNFLSLNHYTNQNVILSSGGGNVGIGTTSPSQKLQVAGNIYTTGSVRIETAGNQLEFGNANVALQRTSNLLELGGYDGIVFKSSNTVLDSQAERMRITATGDVGIGTTSPTDKLQIDAPNSQLRLRDTDDGTFTQFSSSGNKLAIRQNSTTANHLWLTSAGEVGIGTSNPGYTLDVNGTFQGGGLVADPFAPTLNFIGNDVLYGNLSLGALPAKGIFGVADSGIVSDFPSSETIRINSSGNVGIGTSSPGTKLEIAGGDPLLELNTTSATGNPYMMWSQAGTRRSYMQHVDSGDNLTLASEYGGMRFLTGTSGAEVERIRITSSGFVGIGTTNPTTQLDVQGSIQARTHLYFNTLGTSSVPTWGIGLNASGDLVADDISSGKNFLFSNEGNVGIGTVTPATKLSVNGGVQVAHEPDTASAALVGTLRYRTSLNNSYVDMCMQTGATTYAWVNIVSNTW